MEELYNKLGFKQWFSDYSESNHHLKGWRDRDEYLDEVELPKEITLTLLQKWLREKYGVHIVIIPTVTSGWTYKTVRVISELDNDVIIGLKSVDSLPPYKEVCADDFSTFEEALEDGIYESLKLIKI